MPGEMTARRSTYAGLFLVTLATLMYEVLLTRIFSVTMWYHFAFVAISIALFGMTVGAIIVYLFPGFFRPEKVHYQLALSSLLFSLSIVFSFLNHLVVPFSFQLSLTGFYSLVFTYLNISIPFIFSGICVALALTRFAGKVSSLYAADLLGAALGCVLLVYLLNITDAPTAVIGVALFAGLGSLCFSARGGGGGEAFKKLSYAALLGVIGFALFAVFNTLLVYRQSSLLPIMWARGRLEKPPLYEKWNSFSRIKVSGDPERLQKPADCGISAVLPEPFKVRQLSLFIDTSFETFLFNFNGDFKTMEFLRYDLRNLPHYLRNNAKVLVIGSGGGMEILTSLLFKQKSVLGVEINKNIIYALTEKFGDFTGHLERYPQVTIVNDEARSYLARQSEKFDIIQASVIDIWAATAAGSFALMENSLFTKEAWKLFLARLTPGGILTFTRWYNGDKPYEIYRLTALAATALSESGIKNPRAHIVILRNRPQIDNPAGAGTILLSNRPFSRQDLTAINKIAKELSFDLILTPEYSIDSTFPALTSAEELDKLIAGSPVNLAPPTDDCPFFYNLLNLKNIFKLNFKQADPEAVNLRSFYLLTALLLIVLLLTFLCIIVPLMLTTEKTSLKGSARLFLYFAAIGLGFMLVEISQLQRLVIFLGSPAYSLLVVLFSLLLASGLGSWLTQRLNHSRGRILALLFLLIALLIFGLFTPYAVESFQSSTNFIRILIAVAILFPLGLFMGMPFPLGMKLAAGRSPALTPWLWGINGATSVCASVLAMVIALNAGIAATFWTGTFCYLLAFIAFGPRAGKQL